MSAKALEQRGRDAREWLMEACFPLWAERGVYETGGFLEALDLQHRPIESPEARVRVQARQTYVFAVSASMRYHQKSEYLVGLGADILARCRLENGLFARKVDLGKQIPIDKTADLYDTAFALLALSHACDFARQNGDIGWQEAWQRDAEGLIKAIDKHLTDARGGFKEALPPPDLRMQNPHMHLFEALLAANDMIGGDHYLEHARALHALCLEHFIDPETGTLGEYFNAADWSVPEGEAGTVVEPGHQFEWVWLFGQFARQTGSELPGAAHRLYKFACSTLDDKGRAIQSCLRDGTPVDASRRTWQQTEALKAHLAMWKRGDEAAGARAVASFDILMDEYLTPEGGWIDHYDADGQVLSQTMPASTGYHVVLAFHDLIHTVQT